MERVAGLSTGRSAGRGVRRAPLDAGEVGRRRP